MIKKIVFANSFALVMGLLYLFAYLVNLYKPAWFRFFLNIQFFGADIASMVPKMSFSDFAVMIGGIMIVYWFVGFIWALFYNWFIRE